MSQFPLAAVAAAACTALLLGLYITASCVLQHKPHLLHKRKKRYFAAALIAHRGGAGERAENTLEAFQHAVSSGAHMLELDCQLTADGEVVIAHDNCLERICGVDANISDTNYADLPQMLPELSVTFMPNSEKMSAGMDRSIPLLKDLLRQLPASVALNIDVKEQSRKLAAAVAELVQQHRLQHRCVWGNFSHKTVNRMRKLDPSVGRMFSLRATLLTSLLHCIGLLPFLPIASTHYEPPMLSMALEPEANSLWQMVPCPLRCPLRCLLWLLAHLLLRPSLIRHLRLRGIPTFAWVINTDQHFRDAFAAGCEGVMTDYPVRLANFLTDNPDCLSVYNQELRLIQQQASSSEADALIKQ